MTARQGRFAHLGLLVAVGTAYLVIRVGIAPVAGPLRWQATDLLAGVALPSLFALGTVPASRWGRWARSGAGKAQLIAGAVLVWEGLVPLLGRGTADGWDVLAYALGGLAQHGLATVTGIDARQGPAVADRPSS